MIKTVESKGVSILMEVETEYEQHRLDTLFTKEPETISWIEELMSPGDVFFDIGANVGMYTLFVGVHYKGALKTYAFEPAYHNFAKLCKNVLLNKIGGSTSVYPVAVGDKNMFTKLFLASDISGSAMHSMPGGVEHDAHEVAPMFEQGVYAVSLDTFAGSPDVHFPNHIKVDTDGFELQVIEGARNLLKDKRLKSILVEVDSTHVSSGMIKRMLGEAGFVITHSINMQEDHSRRRREELGKTFENIIFTRV